MGAKAKSESWSQLEGFAFRATFQVSNVGENSNLMFFNTIKKEVSVLYGFRYTKKNCIINSHIFIQLHIFVSRSILRGARARAFDNKRNVFVFNFITQTLGSLFMFHFFFRVETTKKSWNTDLRFRLYTRCERWTKKLFFLGVCTQKEIFDYARMCSKSDPVTKSESEESPASARDSLPCVSHWKPVFLSPRRCITLHIFHHT